MNTELMDPLKYFETKGKDTHAQNVSAHFEDLVTRSGVDEKKNAETVAKYHAQLAKNDKLEGKIMGFKVLRVFLILVAIAAVIAAFALFTGEALSPTLRIIIGILCLALAAGMIILVVKKINKIIKDTSALLEKGEEQARALLAEAMQQVAPLLALFDEYDTFHLIEKTFPEIKFDRNWTYNRYDDFVKNYTYTDMIGDNSSVTDTLTGTLFGNPFLFERFIHQDWSTKTYHGTLVIHWVTYERDSEGRTRTVNHTETLHASVQKPIPVYDERTLLHYGHQAAPDLSFSRNPGHAERLSENALERKVKKGEKKIAKKARAALADVNDDFTEMANSEFDVLFGATNRDDEQEFRLLFTPLAQTSIVDLLCSTKGFGDDFYFTKSHKHNIISSEHAVKWNMDPTVSVYSSYDIAEIRKKFNDFNNDYYKSVYFDLAPILAIPAYQAPPSSTFADYDENHPANYTVKEYETLANRIGRRNFAHSLTDTDVILKTQTVGKDGNVDRVLVTAHSFQGIERVDFVSVYGGDGRWHEVPVPWIEYIPVERSTEMSVKDIDMSRTAFSKAGGSENSGAACYHDLYACAHFAGTDVNINSILANIIDKNN